MKDMDYYITMNVKYPNRSDYKTTYYYKAGKCVGHSKSNQPIPEYTVKEDVVDEVSYRADYVEYHREKEKLVNEFKQDLFEELGIQNHPKREALFNKAWENYSIDGYYQVWLEAKSLVELLD